MLMISQYRYTPARKGLENQILNPPVQFFSGMLESIKKAGKIRPDADCRSAGGVIAALFFNYSFRSNLNAAWNEESAREFQELSEELEFIAGSLKA